MKNSMRPPNKVGVSREDRMIALEALFTQCASYCRGISSQYPFNSLVEAIVNDYREADLTPRMDVVKYACHNYDVWEKISPFIDKTTEAWRNFIPPTKD